MDGGGGLVNPALEHKRADPLASLALLVLHGWSSRRITASSFAPAFLEAVGVNTLQAPRSPRAATTCCAGSFAGW